MNVEIVEESVHPRFVNSGDHVIHDGVLKQVSDRYGRPPAVGDNWWWIVEFAQGGSIELNDEDVTVKRLAAVIRL
jgi:hypothetical protein